MSFEINIPSRQTLENVLAAESKICRIDGQMGKRYYRGYSIEELADHSFFEEVTYLLLYEQLPTAEQLRDFSQRLKRRGMISFAIF